MPAKLIYSAIASLDGYVADEDGKFDWGEPDEEVHTFVNDLQRPIGTYLLGRRMYEVLVAWETMTPRRPAARHSRLRGDLAGDRQDRVLQVAGNGIERQDSDRARPSTRSDPTAYESRSRTAISAWVVHTSPPKRSEAGLVDEIHLFLAPIVVGAGNRSPCRTTQSGWSSSC